MLKTSDLVTRMAITPQVFNQAMVQLLAGVPSTPYTHKSQKPWWTQPQPLFNISRLKGTYNIRLFFNKIHEMVCGLPSSFNDSLQLNRHFHLLFLKRTFFRNHYFSQPIIFSNYSTSFSIPFPHPILSPSQSSG